MGGNTRRETSPELRGARGVEGGHRAGLRPAGGVAETAAHRARRLPARGLRHAARRLGRRSRARAPGRTSVASAARLRPRSRARSRSLTLSLSLSRRRGARAQLAAMTDNAPRLTLRKPDGGTVHLLGSAHVSRDAARDAAVPNADSLVRVAAIADDGGSLRSRFARSVAFSARSTASSSRRTWRPVLRPSTWPALQLRWWCGHLAYGDGRDEPDRYRRSSATQERSRP